MNIRKVLEYKNGYAIYIYAFQQQAKAIQCAISIQKIPRKMKWPIGATLTRDLYYDNL